MPPKRATNKKGQTKVAASSTDAKFSSNDDGEKEVLEELATDAKKLLNGSALNDCEESTKSMATKRSSGRTKSVAPDASASKKPVVEAEKKSRGRGGGGKTAEPKKTSKAKEVESVQDEESNEAEEAKKIPVKKSKTVADNRKKQEVVTKEAEEEIELKQEIEEEVLEKAPKKSSRNLKKNEEISIDNEPQKKKGRAAKKDKVVEKDEVEVTTKEDDVVIKEKKPIKRGRGAAKATVEENVAANGDTEEVLPKKRSRKAPSVEIEIAPEKPKRGGRAKKAEKVPDNSSSLVQEKKEDAILNGEVQQKKPDEIEETPSLNIEAEQKAEAAVAAPATKAKGGRKRAAPSTNKKKTEKTAADDNELDEGVINAEMENEADGSKSSKSKKNKTGSAPLNATDTKYAKADFELPPPADGQEVEEPRFNLKISSWNVAGLRSWLKKEGLLYLEYEEPDIFCMQETKCTTEQLPEEVVRIPGYHPYWLCMPGGYAGVAIYSKIMPINVEYGIGNKEFDDCGRIITAEYEKFFLINVYVPNSGRKLVNLEARMKWEKLFQEFIQNLDARKPVVICGDMNVSHQEQDLANPKTNTRNAGFTKEERNKMSELLALGYVDTFRHLYPERKGAYTFWTYMGNARSRNVGWRLDYFIVSERIVKRVVDNCIRSQCMGSDHCPITLFLKL